MACPYLDCGESGDLPAGADSCTTCHRLVKSCPQCAAGNRAFANHCRTCGHALPESAGEWTAFKGGPQRLGLNRWPQAAALRDSRIAPVLHLRLGSPCRSLLSSDRHLIAVAASGAVTIVDVARGTGSAVQLPCEGPVTAEPCVSRSVLYMAAPGRVAAYALGALDLPRTEPRFEVRVTGTPIQTLLALEDRLYLTLHLPDGRREVRRISGIDGDRPGEPELLLTARRPSWLAANPPSRRVLWLAEEDGELRVHWTDHGATAGPPVSSRTVTGAPLPFADGLPIAVMGFKVFAVLGPAESLCRIDAQEGAFDLTLQGDSRSFALLSAREGLSIDTGGLAFFGTQGREELGALDRVRCAPVLLKDCAAAIGLQDGRVRFYDLRNLHLQQEHRVSTDMEEVTCLISFRNYVAAGDAAGSVRVFALSEPGASA